MITSTDDHGVRVLCIAHGKANTFDTELFTALEEALTKAETDAVSALVLTGTGRIFSAGVDLFRIVDGGDDYLDSFLPALSDAFFRTFTCSKPVVAAVNGHAIAGGCILACACDIRLGATGTSRIGIPELRVGVPFPAAALEVMRFAIGDRKLPALVLGGATYSPEAALDLGLLDRLVAPDQLIETAIEEARNLAALGSRAFTLTKRLLHQPTVDTIIRERQRSDGEVLAGWKNPVTQSAIRAYLERTLSR